jgi:hypothetical protein
LDIMLSLKVAENSTVRVSILKDDGVRKQSAIVYQMTAQVKS